MYRQTTSSIIARRGEKSERRGCKEPGPGSTCDFGAHVDPSRIGSYMGTPAGCRGCSDDAAQKHSLSTSSKNHEDMPFDRNSPAGWNFLNSLCSADSEELCVSSPRMIPPCPPQDTCWCCCCACWWWLIWASPPVKSHARHLHPECAFAHLDMSGNAGAIAQT